MRSLLRLRFQIREILIITASVAAFLSFGPRILKRYQVDNALKVVIEKGPVLKNTDEWNLLVSDELRVAERLLDVLQSDELDIRKINAFRTMRTLEGSIAFRKVAMPQLIAIACEGKNEWRNEYILRILEFWIPSTGLTDNERKQLYDRAALHLEHPNYWPVIPWIRVLIATGGQDELQLVVRYFYSVSPRDKAIVCDLLRRQMSEELLPVVERWILDSDCVEYALDMDLLALTNNGQKALLRFALDHTQQLTMRKKAIEKLRLTVGGLDKLDAACAEQATADDLSTLLGIDCRTSFPAERTAILNAESGEAILRSGQPATLRETLESVIETPKRLEEHTFLRRMVPYHLAEIPADCLPLYKQMLTSENPALRYWSCKALLHFSDDPAAIDVAIDLIEQDKPKEHISVQSGAILLLKDRYGVNYFWNTDAWREWAENRKRSAKSFTP